jgi:hypothetical protein
MKYFFCSNFKVNFFLSRKKSIKLGTNWHGGVPIEVLPISHRLVKEKIESLYSGEAVLRQAKCKAVIQG